MKNCCIESYGMSLHWEKASFYLALLFTEFQMLTDVVFIIFICMIYCVHGHLPVLQYHTFNIMFIYMKISILAKTVPSASFFWFSFIHLCKFVVLLLVVFT